MAETFRVVDLIPGVKPYPLDFRVVDITGVEYPLHQIGTWHDVDDERRLRLVARIDTTDDQEISFVTELIRDSRERSLDVATLAQIRRLLDAWRSRTIDHAQFAVDVETALELRDRKG